MKVVVDADSRITEISKTCRPEDAMGESVGIEKITADYSEALARELDQMILQEGLIDIFYERAFERLIPQGHTFKVVDTTHYFSYFMITSNAFFTISLRSLNTEKYSLISHISRATSALSCIFR